MPNLKSIRDSIHNYIEITPIENNIIDQPDFQRLRFIYQNSSAYLTYPSNTNQRFSHSLGVMHNAGLIFTAALKNSDASTLRDFLVEADKKLRQAHKQLHPEQSELAPELVNTWKQTIYNASEFYHDPTQGSRIEFKESTSLAGNSEVKYFLSEMGSQNKHEISLPPLYIINTLWQAIRICGLVHDIGHFPMSHLFEVAIKEYCNSDSNDSNNEHNKTFYQKEIIDRIEAYSIDINIKPSDKLIKRYKSGNIKLHEIRGLYIFNKFQSNSDYENLIHLIATEILLSQREQNNSNSNSNNTESSLYSCLREIISGDIDADRLDYCTRDPKSSGLEFGAIDTNRIITKFIFIKHDDIFKLALSEKALSAAESFYNQRYMLYKYMIHHHSVVRMDGILKEIIKILLSHVFGSKTDDGLYKILINYNFMSQEKLYKHKFMPDEISYLFDDTWLRSMLGNILIYLETSNTNELLKILIDTFLYRKSKNMYSLWKSESEYSCCVKDIPTQKKDRAEELKHAFVNLLGNNSKQNNDINFNIIKNELELDNILIILHKINQRTATEKDEQMIITKHRGTLSLSEASDYIHSLRSIADTFPYVHISFAGENILANNIINKVTKIVESVIYGGINQ